MDKYLTIEIPKNEFNRGVAAVTLEYIRKLIVDFAKEIKTTVMLSDTDDYSMYIIMPELSENEFLTPSIILGLRTAVKLLRNVLSDNNNDEYSINIHIYDYDTKDHTVERYCISNKYDYYENKFVTLLSKDDFNSNESIINTLNTLIDVDNIPKFVKDHLKNIRTYIVKSISEETKHNSNDNLYKDIIKL